MSDNIRDFQIDIPQSTLDDLETRLAMVRWPDPEPVDDWSQGIPLAYVQQVTDYWRENYDWRRCEAALNHYPQHMTEIDGVDIHFMHIRSPEAAARPLIMTHGWPGSIVEFMDVIGPLTDPVAHGGNAKDAYHLVIPSLPGYGFSGKPTETGWGVEKIASAWDVLMTRLGYDRYFAQGGDWGALVTSAIGVQNLGSCAGIHINLVVVGTPPEEVMKNPTPEEQASLARFSDYQTQGGGYAEIQRTKPQTLGYGLADSPVGQMAWVLEKFQGWSDRATTPDDSFDRDHLLDNIMLYWLNNAGASSARLYRESFGNPNVDPVHLSTGCSIFPNEIMAPSRRWAEQRFKNLQYWGEADKGGHFAAMEVPELFVKEVRSCFGQMEL
ncbi:epoxide hydrolase family protein [Parasphingorhabdus cellanae]|uniref:Epoxide hydrolase n=1 Tax=Parasphingorhabdus cellanae TaxID=2806553 RepID=A0ABX7T5U8_9SPHN|nr:epoxide hydrolase family protein [Parasphingorhabdus cellanae]QTD55348.1 epoxide hydrolase [Parasphingorhabdus cellanae]